LAGILVPPPYGAADVCAWCRCKPGEGYDLCYGCGQANNRLFAPCPLIVPVSLYEIPSQLHHLLRNYKDGLSSQRSEFSVKVVCVLCTFLHHHRACIGLSAGGDWDVITSVPSTSGKRAGEHPLVRALRAVPAFFEQHEELLAPGPTLVGHNRFSDEGFRVTRPVVGRRVLLVDDTLTSGARAQSAASALNLAGATVVAIVPVGRTIKPSFNEAEEWWKRRRRTPFDFNTCCLEPF
jgi:hypothetical protein